MKNIYILILIGALMFFTNCKSKKTVTDKKEETEVLVTESSNQTSLVTENEQKRESKTAADKTIFEEWMSIKSDVAVMEDKDGNKWTFTNPRIAKTQTHSNDIVKSQHYTDEKVKATQTEEKAYSDRKESINTDVYEKHTSKDKQPVWVWFVAVGFFGMIIFLVLRWFRLL